MTLFRGPGRLRAFMRFIAAVLWIVLAYMLAIKAAHGFSRGIAFPLIRNLFYIFLLVIGHGYMELAWENTREPVRAMGLGNWRTRSGEFGLGVALGWGMAVAVVLGIAIGSKFYIRISNSPQAWGMLVLQTITIAAGALAEEIAFRGYAFQKLIGFTGSWFGTILAGVFFALLRAETPGATSTAMWLSGAATVLLSVAYLRTRALWICWGLHFAWLASIGLLFGQPLAETRFTASVVQTYIDGPSWLTGSEYGPEGSLMALAVVLCTIFVLLRVTRDIAWKINEPQLKPAGIPLDLNHPMHPASPPAAASVPTDSLQFASAVGGLVQIAPVRNQPIEGPSITTEGNPPKELPERPRTGESVPNVREHESSSEN